MANAIHMIEAGETLAAVAAKYYALEDSSGNLRDIELAKVTRAIRQATPGAASTVADGDVLAAGTILHIPTLRELNRAVFGDHPAVQAALRSRGFDHARKLLRHEIEAVVGYLSPAPPDYTDADVRRAWMLTALLNLDGMDLYTARYFHDSLGIASLIELANQSLASLDSALAALIAPPHSRPAELATQGHAKRWRLGARIQVRRRIGELAKVRYCFFQVPFAPAVSQAQAEFYEVAATQTGTTTADANLAARLGTLYRFQAAVLRGHFGVRSSSWAEAVAGYREARRHWHRLAEATGAAAGISEDDGINLATSIDAVRRILDDLPGEDDSPLGAPPIRLRNGGNSGTYRLRGFRYSELAPVRKHQLRDALSAIPIHRLPARVRAAIYQAVLDKTWGELKNADPNLVQGLVPGSDTTLARDFDSRDRDLLRRNVGGATVGVLYEGGTGLNVFEGLGEQLALADLSSILPRLWDAPAVTGKPAGKLSISDVISGPSKAAYAPEFVSRDDVTPFIKFVSLPGETGRPGARYLPLSGDLHAAYATQILKPRLASGRGQDLVFDDAAWASAGSFAAIAPYVYSSQIPLGLRRAYAATGQAAQAMKFGGQRVDLYRADGTAMTDRMNASPSGLAFDPDLQSCSTSWEPGAGGAFELLNYATASIATADFKYRKDKRHVARSYYADVRCALERVYPEFADEARFALTGVFNTIRAVNAGSFDGSPENRNLARLTTLAVEYVRDGTTHQVMEDSFLPVRTPRQGTIDDTAVNAATIHDYFEWNGIIDVNSGDTKTGQEIVDEYLDDDTTGKPASAGGTDVYVDHDGGTQSADAPVAVGKDEYYALYLYCEAQINAIDAGLNWYGYGDEFVPCWSFEHLYDISRDLCNRALDAEQRVFALLQMYETALTQEFLASQQQELAGAQAAVAEAQVTQQVASNALATAQALYSQQQAQAQAKKSGLWADIATVTAGVIGVAGAAISTVVSGGAAAPAVIVGASAFAGATGGLIGTVTGHTQDVAVLDQAIQVTLATQAASAAALSVAIAQRDVTNLQEEQASAYVDFLAAQTLNSEAYLYLMGRAKEILEVYIHHANRMSWLAERALEHETRQSYDLIQLDYAINDGLADTTRAQQLTADLEALRAQYVAGQTTRLQELKWTIALSQLDSIAWKDLRDTGTCTFVLRQRTLDMCFPGMYQHRLKDIRMEIVGLIPPEGARGTLTNPGVSWVRVPNDESFLAEQTRTDWVTNSLAVGTEFPKYDQYVLKRLLTNVVVLSLSQFDARADRAVLSSPQGMLKPVEHQGLDSAWTLTLNRQSNNFEFANIGDVEFTFWFLSAYDPGLEQAQQNALVQEGRQGKLTAASKTAFAIQQPDTWAAFVGDAPDPEALDLRYLSVDVAALPPWEAQRKLTNILLGVSRATPQSKEITLRLCSQYDPVGIGFTTRDGAVFSAIGIDLSSEESPPTLDSAFQDWVRAVFYHPVDVPVIGKVDVPYCDPQARWVIKAAPALAGDGWLKKDDDGNGVATSSGPLLGGPGCLASYRDGSAWTDFSFRIKLAHRNGTIRLRLRDNGTDHYALQISPAELRLFRVVKGVDTALGRAIPAAFPAQEFLSVDVRVVGDALAVSVDGITVFDAVPGKPPAGRLQAGTVALQVVAGTEPAAFDDAKVLRLTGMGEEAETLLSQPFTGTLPEGWTYANGAIPWSISPAGHALLDLSGLLNAVLSLDYRYQMNLG